MNDSYTDKRLDINSHFLQILLLLDIILLDKLHNRSNISLLLIHLQTIIDNHFDNINNINNDNLFDEYDLVMNTIFKHSEYFNINQLKIIYTDNIRPMFSSSVDVKLLLNYDSIIINLLCCSDSLQDFIKFNGVFDKDLIKNNNLEQVRSHFLLNAFNSKTNTNTSTVDSNLLSDENMKIVKSKKFTDFHINRWNALNLLDRHIFT